MPQSTSLTHSLMSDLEAKVKLILSETLTLNLEIAQLQQENARLRAQLTEWNKIDIGASQH